MAECDEQVSPFTTFPSCSDEVSWDVMILKLLKSLLFSYVRPPGPSERDFDGLVESLSAKRTPLRYKGRQLSFWYSGTAEGWSSPRVASVTLGRGSGGGASVASSGAVLMRK